MSRVCQVGMGATRPQCHSLSWNMFLLQQIKHRSLDASRHVLKPPSEDLSVRREDGLGLLLLRTLFVCLVWYRDFGIKAC